MSLSEIQKISDLNQRKTALSKFAKDNIANNNVKALKDFIDQVLNEKLTPQSISRDAFFTLADNLKDLNDDPLIEVANHALQVVSSRSAAFEDHIFTIRWELSKVYQEKEDFKGAAKVLMAIPLESVRDPHQKLRLVVQIVRLHQEEEDDVAAGTYLSKAGGIEVPNLKTVDQKLYQALALCFAKNYDLKREFHKAASKYYEMSQQVPEKDRMPVLEAAITCAILAPAGPLRSRLLATLVKDERSQKTDQWPVLEKMFFGHIIRKTEVEKFKEELKPHQLAKLSDNTTVLERAIIQHNILAASAIYNNIYFSELGTLLDITPERAETTCAEMMIEGRLNGSIDQLAKLIVFQDATEELNTWDSHINNLCNDVNRIVDHIVQKYPQFVE